MKNKSANYQNEYIIFLVELFFSVLVLNKDKSLKQSLIKNTYFATHTSSISSLILKSKVETRKFKSSIKLRELIL